MTKEQEKEYKEELSKLPRSLTKKQKAMLIALSMTMNNVSKACKQVSITRKTHYEWMHKSDIYKKEVESRKEAEIDLVESAFKKNIFKGNVVAQIFYLKTKAKDRGYVERTEVVGVDNEPPAMIVAVLPDNGRD